MILTFPCLDPASNEFRTLLLAYLNRHGKKYQAVMVRPQFGNVRVRDIAGQWHDAGYIGDYLPAIQQRGLKPEFFP